MLSAGTGSFAAVALPVPFCWHIRGSAVGTQAGGAASCANYPLPRSDSSPPAHVVPLTLQK